jgi:hypothetical protein
LRILEEITIGGINITIEENDFNIITFEEVLPRRNASDFQEDLDKFERFARNYMNETNLAVDLNFTGLKCLSFTISPYNITYTHLPDGSECEKVSAQTEIVIDPQESWKYLNSYTLVFKPDGNIADASITGWGGPGCDKGNLGLNVTVIGNDTTYGPSVTSTRFDKMCRINIDQIDCPDGLGFIHVIHNQNSKSADNGTLSIQVQPNCNVTSIISLNLTDIPGKVRVDLAPQSIKVRETLYQIEKNDTVYIYGS